MKRIQTFFFLIFFFFFKDSKFYLLYILLLIFYFPLSARKQNKIYTFLVYVSAKERSQILTYIYVLYNNIYYK